MTKKQIVEELAKRMVYYNDEYEYWLKKAESQPENTGLIRAVEFCYGKATAYEDAYRLIKGA